MKVINFVFGHIDFNNSFKLISMINRIFITILVKTKKVDPFDSTSYFSERSQEPVAWTKLIVFQIICTPLNLFIGAEIIRHLMKNFLVDCIKRICRPHAAH